MAVPKRRMSRSNTRSRRSQWKATAPTLVACSNRACRATEAAARRLPRLRHVQRPPGRHTGLTPRRGLCRNAVQRDPRLIVGPFSRRWVSSSSDELLTLALTHRSYAYENGGLPTNERLEFLGDSVLSIVVTDRALPRPPGAAGGTAGEAALQRGQHARAGRGGRHARRARRARRLPLPRPRRGADRRAHQAEHPRRRHRGADRRGVPGARAGDRPRARAPPVRLAAAQRPAARGGPGLEDQPPGAHGRGRPRRARVPHRRGGPRPPEDVHGHGRRRGPGPGVGRGAHQEGSRAEGRRAGLARPHEEAATSSAAGS